MLSAKEERILAAIQAGHQFIYKIAIDTDIKTYLVKQYVKQLVADGYIRKSGMGNHRLSVIPQMERQNKLTRQNFLIRNYDKLPRRELASRLGMSKMDLNMLLLELGLGQ